MIKLKSIKSTYIYILEREENRHLPKYPVSILDSLRAEMLEFRRSYGRDIISKAFL